MRKRTRQMRPVVFVPRRECKLTAHAVRDSCMPVAPSLPNPDWVGQALA